MKRLILLLLYIPFCAVQLRAQNPNVAKFPTALVTDGDIGVAKNRARALLTGGINAADLTINVDNGAAFASPSWGSIDQEYIKLCSVAGNVVTVCAGGRGAFGTTAAVHASGSTLLGPLVAEHVNQLAAEVKGIETALGASLANVVRIAGSYSDPSWLTLTKAKVGLANVENVALTTWAGSSSITTIGALGTYVKAPKQINFSLFDPNAAIPASTIPGIWMAEYGAATVTKVSCSADTADAVIQIKKNTSTNVLGASLTCGNGSWLNTTTFAAASFALGDNLGLQVVSGTAKRINVSIQYTQQ